MFRESEGKNTHTKGFETNGTRHSDIYLFPPYCCAFRSSRQSLFGEVWYSHLTPVSKGDPKDDREAQVIQETEDPVVGHPFNTWWKIDFSLLGIHTPAHLLGRQGRDLISVSREYWATTTKKNLSNLLLDCWVQIGKWKLHFHQSIWWWEPESDFFSWVHE